MRSETITCDVCGAVKQASNHWYVLVVEDNGKAFISIYLAVDYNVAGQRVDICGQACIIRKVSQLIGKTEGECSKV
jgi:uncharacterized protein (DUF486 family)